MRAWLVALVLVCGPSAFASAQPLPPGVRGGPVGGGMLTRSASKYQALETRIQQALQARTASELDALVPADFEATSAERAGAQSRDEWQHAGAVPAARTFRIRELTVREFGPQAIVSFLLERQRAGATVPSTTFVVDVWDTVADTLQVRYESVPARPVASSGRHE